MPGRQAPDPIGHLPHKQSEGAHSSSGYTWWDYASSLVFSPIPGTGRHNKFFVHDSPVLRAADFYAPSELRNGRSQPSGQGQERENTKVAIPSLHIAQIRAVKLTPFGQFFLRDFEVSAEAAHIFTQSLKFSVHK